VAAELVDVELEGKRPGDARGRGWERHEDQARGELEIVGRDPLKRGALAVGLDAH
jgi:hypothetical protein